MGVRDRREGPTSLGLESSEWMWCKGFWERRFGESGASTQLEIRKSPLPSGSSPEDIDYRRRGSSGLPRAGCACPPLGSPPAQTETTRLTPACRHLPGDGDRPGVPVMTPRPATTSPQEPRFQCLAVTITWLGIKSHTRSYNGLITPRDVTARASSRAACPSVLPCCRVARQADLQLTRATRVHSVLCCGLIQRRRPGVSSMPCGCLGAGSPANIKTPAVPICHQLTGAAVAEGEQCDVCLHSVPSRTPGRCLLGRAGSGGGLGASVSRGWLAVRGPGQADSVPSLAYSNNTEPPRPLPAARGVPNTT